MEKSTGYKKPAPQTRKFLERITLPFSNPLRTTGI